ncbi:MAG: hypothetical protein R3B45_08295 [Bdellovibrionota bacterium]
MNLALILDTTIQGVSMGLIDLSSPSKGYLWKEAHLKKFGSAQSISRLFKKAMDSIQSKPEAISRIVISNGPGSFTGIKIGLSWASGFAQGLKGGCYFQALSSLESAAHEQFLNASKKKTHPEGFRLVFLAGSTKTHGFVTVIDQYSASTQLFEIKSEDFKNLLHYKEKCTYLVLANVWPEFELFKQQNINELNIEYISLTDEETSQLVLDGMARKAFEALNDDLEKNVLAPNFMRESTAEERLKRKVGINGI